LRTGENLSLSLFLMNLSPDRATSSLTKEMDKEERERIGPAAQRLIFLGVSGPRELAMPV